jgi:D-amino-acid dehydrogenase
MSTLQGDVVVLGAGMVGVSVAVHLQQRGKQVVLVDRRPPGEETSYGNGGLVQREAVFPHPFPRSFAELRRIARNRSVDAYYHLSALPGPASAIVRLLAELGTPPLCRDRGAVDHADRDLRRGA